MNEPESDPSGLFSRLGWPDELKVLLSVHPRDGWDGHQNLGPMSRFWLERHAMFRELGTALQSSSVRIQDGSAEPHAFAQWFFPRAGFFLQQLHTHHNVEDQHYFPIFREADARLTRGFDVLDGDHETLDDLIHRFANVANAFQAALNGAGSDWRRAGEALHTTATITLNGLLRHLGDEEDLIIPLVLDRTEAALGVG